MEVINEFHPDDNDSQGSFPWSYDDEPLQRGFFPGPVDGDDENKEISSNKFWMVFSIFLCFFVHQYFSFSGVYRTFGLTTSMRSSNIVRFPGAVTTGAVAPTSSAPTLNFNTLYNLIYPVCLIKETNFTPVNHFHSEVSVSGKHNNNIKKKEVKSFLSGSNIFKNSKNFKKSNFMNNTNLTPEKNLSMNSNLNSQQNLRQNIPKIQSFNFTEIVLPSRITSCDTINSTNSLVQNFEKEKVFKFIFVGVFLNLLITFLFCYFFLFILNVMCNYLKSAAKQKKIDQAVNEANKENEKLISSHSLGLKSFISTFSTTKFFSFNNNKISLKSPAVDFIVIFMIILFLNMFKNQALFKLVFGFFMLAVKSFASLVSWERILSFFLSQEILAVIFCFFDNSCGFNFLKIIFTYFFEFLNKMISGDKFKELNEKIQKLFSENKNLKQQLLSEKENTNNLKETINDLIIKLEKETIASKNQKDFLEIQNKNKLEQLENLLKNEKSTNENLTNHVKLLKSQLLMIQVDNNKLSDQEKKLTKQLTDSLKDKKDLTDKIVTLDEKLNAKENNQSQETYADKDFSKFKKLQRTVALNIAAVVSESNLCPTFLSSKGQKCPNDKNDSKYKNGVKECKDGIHAQRCVRCNGFFHISDDCIIPKNK